MKLTVTAFFFMCIATIQCFSQSDYDQIRMEDIFFEDITLSDLQGILKKIGNKVPRKIYTPPTGDTDEYDKIHYYENKDINLDLYESSGKLSLSSITIKTDKYKLKVLGDILKVGSSELMLSKFQKSYGRFIKLKSNDKAQKEFQFHLDIIYPNGAQAILTLRIKDQRVIELSISQNSA